MTDTEQLHQDFMRDFTKLLQLYGADFEVYDGISEIFFHGVYEDGETIIPCSSITLPNYINPRND